LPGLQQAVGGIWLGSSRQLSGFGWTPAGSRRDLARIRQAVGGIWMGSSRQ